MPTVHFTRKRTRSQTHKLARASRARYKRVGHLLRIISCALKFAGPCSVIQNKRRNLAGLHLEESPAEAVREYPRPMRLSKPRLSPLDRSKWSDPDVRAALDVVQSGVGGPENPLNVFTTFARHPKLLKNFLGFGNHMLFNSTLDPRERQLIILRTGYLCKSKYEWGHHTAIGKRVGLTDDEIARVKIGPKAPDWLPIQKAVLQVVDELHNDQMVSDSAWTELCRLYDEQRAIEVVALVGLYTLVSMFLNTCGVQLEPGVECDVDFAQA